jgi:protein-L-isoaspartate(D-aspartate) O-methyltransferase
VNRFAAAWRTLRDNDGRRRLIATAALLPWVARARGEEPFARDRERMLDEIDNRMQLTGERTGHRRLAARVHRAMARVPRHRFIPPEERLWAYADRALPIGEGQTISQPFVVALMTELLQPEPTDHVLEVGTGSGYQAAVLAECVAHVFTIEIVRALGERAAALLSELGYRNVEVRIGDGYLGWPEAAPFDRVIVTAAPDHVPQALIDQLKPGGRMVVPVGPRDLDQVLLLLTKDMAGRTVTESNIPVRFVPLIHERSHNTLGP